MSELEWKKNDFAKPHVIHGTTRAMTQNENKLRIKKREENVSVGQDKCEFSYMINIV